MVTGCNRGQAHVSGVTARGTRLPATGECSRVAQSGQDPEGISKPITHCARFIDFVKSPATVATYIRDVLTGREARYFGRNPAGGYMIVVLLLNLSALSISVLLLRTDAFWGSDDMELIHSRLAGIALLCTWRACLPRVRANVRISSGL